MSESVVGIAPPAANLTQSVPGAVPSPAGLRACWSADASAADVVGGNNGTLNGAASYIAGRFGQAFNFGAITDGVAVPNPSSSNLAAIGAGPGITFSAWIFPRGVSFGGAPGAGPIVEFDFGAQMWQHNQQGDNFGLFTNMALSNALTDWRILQIPHVITWNAWQHVAATYDRSTGVIQLWVNGVPVGSSTVGVIVPNTLSSTFRIGQRVSGSFTGGDFAFNGAIDEVQVYGRALGAAEVAQLAAATGTMCVPPPASFQVTQMPVGSGESGVPFTTQPQVAILDASGHVVSNATTPVTASVFSGTGTLIGTTTVNAVGGVATFTNLAIAGASPGTVVTFTAGALPATGTTTSSPLATVQVARALGISTQPGGAPSGSPLAPQPVVEVRDAAGLRMPNATNAITAAIASGTGTLSGTTTVNAAAASSAATFTNLVVTGAGTASLGFSSPGLTGVTSNVFTVAATAPTQLAVLTPASGGESGMPFTTQPVIEVRDANGNRATAATGSVTVTMTGTGGTLAGPVTAPIVNGLATFAGVKVNGFGTFTLSYAAPGLAGAAQAPVTVVQQVRTLAIVQGPAVVATGVVMSPAWVVELRDAAGIKVATSTYLVRANLAGGSLAGTTERNAVAGVVTFNDLVATSAPGAAIQVTFWITDPAAYALAYAVSNPLTVLANVTGAPYAWTGFDQPVDNLPKTNSVQAGSTIPVKFGLGGDKGLDIFLAGSPASRPASCDTFAATGAALPIDVKGDGDDDDHATSLAAPNANTYKWLKYNDRKYQFEWKTDKAWKGTCRTLVLSFRDGSVRTANFEFKK